MALQNLSRVSTLSAGDLVALFSASAGLDATVTLAALAEWVNAQTVPAVVNGFATQYAAPSATGFSVEATPPTAGASVHVLMTPGAAYAAGSIGMPAAASCVQGQEVLVTCTQAVASFIVAGNGATVNGGPTALAANAFFRLRFDAVLTAWLRVG